jgi:hypothetical protein
MESEPFERNQRVEPFERCASCGGWVSHSCVVCRGEPIEGVDIRSCARGVGQVDRVCRRWAAKQDDEDEEREAA